MAGGCVGFYELLFEASCESRSEPQGSTQDLGTSKPWEPPGTPTKGRPKYGLYKALTNNPEQALFGSLPHSAQARLGYRILAEPRRSFRDLEPRQGEPKQTDRDNLGTNRL